MHADDSALIGACLSVCLGLFAMKHTLILAFLAVSAANGAAAQDFGFTGRTFSFDGGLGVSYGPEYPGSEDDKARPWIILRNGGFTDADGDARQGFSILPSFGLEGERKASDSDHLTGMEDVDIAYEVGLGLRYDIGALRAFGTVRRGFGGHEGLVGEVGAKYRTDLSDRVTLWSGLQLGYGNGDYNTTYFGVTPAEAIPGRSAYDLGGGFNSAAITFEARYAVNDSIAVLGEVQYGKLIGDAADSPLVQEEYQPLLRIGVIRKFSFGF